MYTNNRDNSKTLTVLFTEGFIEQSLKKVSTGLQSPVLYFLLSFW